MIPEQTTFPAVTVTPRVGILLSPEELQVVQDALRWAEREWSATQATLRTDPARIGAVGLQDLFNLKRGICREVRARLRSKGRSIGIEFAD